jgi:hypothetical protein
MSLSKFSLSNDALFEKKSDVVIGERRFYLNKSKSKCVSVALNYHLNFEPSITISGNKHNSVVFTEQEFKKFLEYQGIITHSLYQGEEQSNVDCESFTLQFPRLYDCVLLKIVKNDSSVCLNYDTTCSLWDLLPLIEYVCDLLKRREFRSYFKIIQNSIIFSGGSLKEEALKLLSPKLFSGNQDVGLCLEFVLMHPDIFMEDCKTKVQL